MEQSQQSYQQPSGSGAGQPNQANNSGQQKNTGMAVVAYILFFIPLLTEAKNDLFVKYHVKQGLMLFIIEVILLVVSPILWLVTWVLQLVVLLLAVLGIVNALNGKQEPLPVVGKYAEKFKI